MQYFLQPPTMLTESFIAATLATSTRSNVPGILKDIGIVLHQFQPQSTIKHGFKKSSTKVNCVAFSDTHIFAAQADRAVVLVYNREKGNQEATVPFPERISSLDFVGESSGFVILGTESGRLTLWDVASGRQSISTASHLQPVSCLSVLPDNNFILSGSSDSNVHVWSLPLLVSFSQPQSLSSHDPPHNAPLRTFSNHRSGITALACGHSKFSTNFAASVSSNGTCYVWRTSDCQLLQTILLPSAPQCLAIDPADRALYFGHDDGSVQCFDFYSSAQNGPFVTSAGFSPPIQLDAKDSWSPASTDIGSAQCLTLSYDGMTLLSGHSSGQILSWDIAKHRVQKVIADLGNSITNIAMQRPEGLPSKRPRVGVAPVVKPKLDLSSSTETGTSGIPANYSLYAQIAPPQSGPLTPPHETDFQTILTHPTFPKSLIDEAILDLTFPEQTTHITTTAYDIPFDPSAPPDPLQCSPQITTLQSRIALLEENLSIYVSAAERSRARRLARMERREHYGERKREAYFEAVKRGEDGDSAMKGWEEKEREVDVESDDVEMGESVYADV
jgi:pre-rRNA-processing protein IPI3